MKRPESSCSTVGLENPHTTSSQSSRALDCILALDKLAERPGITLVEIHKALAALLPPAAKFPEAASARVTVDGAAYASPLLRVTPIIICSGNTVSMNEPQALGFRGFVRKPYTMVALAARIRRALDD